MTMHILRARLEAEGIPAILADANMAQSYSLVSVAVGGVRLQVPAEFVDEARQIIADVNSGALAMTDEDDVGSPLDTGFLLRNKKANHTVGLFINHGFINSQLNPADV